MTRLRAIFLCALVVVSAWVARAEAYEVTPMIYELTPSGRGAAINLQVSNTAAAPLAVELQAELRSFDARGQESRAPADADFVLFPPQAIILPGKTQAVRVHYVGDAALARTNMYVITVRQVPIALQSAESGVQFLFNFSTLALVSPAQARANVVVAGIEQDAETLRLTLENTGDRYANLARASLTLAAGQARHTLTGEEWQRLIGTTWLLPGAQRVVELPRPEASSAPWTATISLIEDAP